MRYTRWSLMRAVGSPASGRWLGRDVVVFELYQGQMAASSCALFALSAQCPDLFVSPKTVEHGVADDVGALTIGFESERFNEAFRLPTYRRCSTPPPISSTTSRR
jgi:hypothetical protein